MSTLDRCTLRSLFVAALAVVVPCQLSGQDGTDYDGWYDAVRTLTPDASRGAVVQNLMLLREGATFLLESGQLQLLEPVDGRTWYLDLDGDGDGTVDSALNACLPPANYVVIGTDCDDADPHVRGTGPEVCDGIDNDCDGEVDEVKCSVPDPDDTVKGEEDGGCGCASAPTGAPVGWLALLALVGLRRSYGTTRP